MTITGWPASTAAQIAAPVEWAALSPEERIDADQALAREQSNLNAKRAMLASERAVLRERVQAVRGDIRQPHLGLQPAQLAEIARLAEDLGYHSLWTFQRLLAAVDADGAPLLLPQYRSVLDPIALLAYLAAVTDRVRLGVAVLFGTDQKVAARPRLKLSALKERPR